MMEEERKLAEERAVELAALRRKMAAETEEALLQQEKDLGVLIGRLEVTLRWLLAKKV